MGYRSDVMAVFYTYDPNEYPSIKLFIDEHVPEWCRGDEHMSTFTKANLHGIKFEFLDVKWYSSYADVRGFEEAIDKFEKLSDGGHAWLWEFVRLGEEVEDVEDKHSYQADGLLHVSRSIECDF